MRGCACAVAKKGAMRDEEELGQQEVAEEDPDREERRGRDDEGVEEALLLLGQRGGDELHRLVGEDGAVEDGRQDHRGDKVDLEGLAEVAGDERPAGGQEVELHPGEEEGHEGDVCPGEGDGLRRLGGSEHEDREEAYVAEEGDLHPVLELADVLADVEGLAAHRADTFQATRCGEGVSEDFASAGGQALAT